MICVSFIVHLCKKCGKIEDAVNCEPRNIEKIVLKDSKNFKKIRSHSLEFFGPRNGCA